MNRFLLVDFENVPDVDLTRVPGPYKIIVFLGKNHAKIPYELVSKYQTIGARLKWLKFDIQGKNALDFAIANYIPSQIPDDTIYCILSRDKGFDALSYLGRGFYRVSDLSTLPR